MCPKDINLTVNVAVSWDFNGQRNGKRLDLKSHPACAFVLKLMTCTGSFPPTSQLVTSLIQSYNFRLDRYPLYNWSTRAFSTFRMPSHMRGTIIKSHFPQCKRTNYSREWPEVKSKRQIGLDTWRCIRSWKQTWQWIRLRHLGTFVLLWVEPESNSWRLQQVSRAHMTGSGFSLFPFLSREPLIPKIK